MTLVRPASARHIAYYKCDGECGKHFRGDDLELCECGRFYCVGCLTEHLANSTWCLAYTRGLHG